MPASVLHILFNTSAAADLRMALKESGRSDRVVSLMDSLSFGPINPPEGELRARWVEEELGYSDWEEVTHEAALFWTQATAPADRKIAWMSRRSVQEYSGFLEWLSRMGDEPFELIDLTDVMVVACDRDDKPTAAHLAVSLGLLPAYQILENGLLDRAEPISPVVRDRYRKLWARLRAENAAFRVLADDSLVSAPLTHFDPLLLSHVRPEWQKAAMVIGGALADFLDTSLIQFGDLELAARLRALAAAGQLESQGDLMNIRHSEVRLPATPPNKHQ